MDTDGWTHPLMRLLSALHCDGLTHGFVVTPEQDRPQEQAAEGTSCSAAPARAGAHSPEILPTRGHSPAQRTLGREAAALCASPALCAEPQGPP